MKKLLIVFLFLLTGALAWCFRPEYGSGYSEEQRRLWNERREIYPVEWLMCTTITGKDLSAFSQWAFSGWGLKNWQGTFSEIVSDLVTEKGKREEVLDRVLFENRDLSGPEYKDAPALGAAVSQLPLVGLTAKDVAERALAGDGDACLQMVRYLCRNSIWGVGELSWRERREINQWLDRAMALKRPGALFLKCFFQEECKAEASLPETGRNMKKWEERAKQRLGYDDYLACVGKGDYLLYATVACLCSYGVPPEEYQLMYDVLRKGAERGQVVAQRNLAALCFDSPLYKWEYFLFCEIGRDEQRQKAEWESGLEVFPESWRYPVISRLVPFGIIRAGNAPVVKIYREAARYARKSALQGDLTARYLWLRYGLRGIRRFSVEEWADIFAYDRQLFASGYNPYRENPGSGTLSDAVLRSFYSKESWGARRNDGNDREMLWSWAAFPPCRLGDVVRMNDARETRCRLDALELVGQTDYFLKNLIGGDARVVLFAASAEVQACLLEKVRKWAEEGDVLAVCALAEFYKKGIAHSIDPQRAYFMYELVLSKENAASRIFVPVRREDSPEAVYLSLRQVAILGRAELVLDYPDFPGRNEKEACEKLFDFVSSDEDSYYCYYLLGQFCERGLGRSMDRKKALEFYEKEKIRSHACLKAVERLGIGLGTGQGSGKDETEKKTPL